MVFQFIKRGQNLDYTKYFKVKFFEKLFLKERILKIILLCELLSRNPLFFGFFFKKEVFRAQGIGCF